MNNKTNKKIKTLQEQHKEYLLDLDPNSSDATIGHTKAPFIDDSKTTNTSDQLVSQKNFVPLEFKQHSVLKHKNELEGNKPIETKENVYAAPISQKDILNIGEGKRNKLRYEPNPINAGVISKRFKDIKSAILDLSSKLSIRGNTDSAAEDLDHIVGLLTTIEQRMLENGTIDNPTFVKKDLEEEFKSKAQAKYFYAQANKPGKTGKKWSKMADEFSDKTDFSKLPNKIKENNNIASLEQLLENLLGK